ncbi:transcriptional regulators containing a DNA-binding HTH domain and an aminotransferase domain (MocR family) and their eukaryotic orthologs [Moorella thermoacetica Y72]|uniref:Transcriptional regulators containing a DNA-binding HTH domain and an aminotransferase domain (MocR family) and their eukaryotic orthologs n=1 Tax=Moorella thermoacetica Y72 TaxID=1325331 RepID=A0A0S6UC83_NEOTH|nr:transcriptional regulators containing a DNA-binding HTH domain and an aminotransferase domain (MocR family) and their eukaryotic orthologs [Moorella thermoacetica Y72]
MKKQLLPGSSSNSCFFYKKPAPGLSDPGPLYKNPGGAGVFPLKHWRH